MSMEIYVLSDRRLAAMAEWQQAIDQADLDLRLPADAVFADLSGFLPVRMKGLETGFECDHWDVADVLDGTYHDVSFDRTWNHALAFRWGASFEANRAAWMAASAYARATDGVVFDPESGELHTPARAAEIVREIEASPIDEAMIVDMLRKAGLIP
ncbi:hypothetical protein RA307_29455 [Xanthobacteraceae bacterium Astr-EGSB]|uniref:hypothetical protein n=1 Tax=Astrobacterium formosum TaxID=3069710 RepID=UPI0027B531A0|nr:hypothetical protein [Xanthobacteraceae bacterium Astr-EGSB]